MLGRYSNIDEMMGALECVAQGIFLKTSDDSINRIEGLNYLENKLKHNSYPKDSLIVAEKKFIKIH